MVCGPLPKTRQIYSTPPCPSLAASTAAYRRRSFSDSHPKNRCIFCSISAEYPSMPHSLIQNLLRGQDTTAQSIREVILDHILSGWTRGRCQGAATSRQTPDLRPRPAPPVGRWLPVPGTPRRATPAGHADRIIRFNRDFVGISKTIDTQL